MIYQAYVLQVSWYLGHKQVYIMHILYWFNSEGAIMKEAETDKNLMLSEASPALLEPQQGLFLPSFTSQETINYVRIKPLILDILWHE